MKWIPLSERKPTAEDADENGEVLWKLEKGQTIPASWAQIYCLQRATHFARIRDIELPPPAPVMPERLEFVKAKPGEIGDKYSICLKDTLKAFHGCDLKTQSNYTLYRRVEPGKRIVFEVGETRAPKRGDWFVCQGSMDVCRCNIDWASDPRTILLLAEGQEFLK